MKLYVCSISVRERKELRERVNKKLRERKNWTRPCTNTIEKSTYGGVWDEKKRKKKKKLSLCCWLFSCTTFVVIFFQWFSLPLIIISMFIGKLHAWGLYRLFLFHSTTTMFHVFLKTTELSGDTTRNITNKD